MVSVDRRLEVVVEAVLERCLASILVEHAAQDQAVAHWIMRRSQQLRAEAAALRGAGNDEGWRVP